MDCHIQRCEPQNDAWGLAVGLGKGIRLECIGLWGRADFAGGKVTHSNNLPRVRHEIWVWLDSRIVASFTKKAYRARGEVIDSAMDDHTWRFGNCVVGFEQFHAMLNA